MRIMKNMPADQQLRFITPFSLKNVLYFVYFVSFTIVSSQMYKISYMSYESVTTAYMYIIKYIKSIREIYYTNTTWTP